jgi:hypothetical protein
MRSHVHLPPGSYRAAQVDSAADENSNADDVPDVYQRTDEQ